MPQMLKVGLEGEAEAEIDSLERLAEIIRLLKSHLKVKRQCAKGII